MVRRPDENLWKCLNFKQKFGISSKQEPGNLQKAILLCSNRFLVKTCYKFSTNICSENFRWGYI